MIVCIQNKKEVKGKTKPDNFILSIRLKGAEAMRFWSVMDNAKSRDAYCERTDVTRELFGLNPPQYLTKGDIEFFRTGKKVAKTGILAAEITLTSDKRKKKTG